MGGLVYAWAFLVTVLSVIIWFNHGVHNFISFYIWVQIKLYIVRTLTVVRDLIIVLFGKTQNVLTMTHKTLKCTVLIFLLHIWNILEKKQAVYNGNKFTFFFTESINNIWPSIICCLSTMAFRCSSAHLYLCPFISCQNHWNKNIL